MSTYVTKLSKTFNLKRVDAKAPLSVKVMPKDVKKATKKDSSACAFARAACRQLPKVEGAIFFRSSAWLLSEGILYRYLLPKKAREQVKEFDRSGKFEKGTYELLPPSGSQKIGRVIERSKKRPGRHQPGTGKIARKVVHHATDVRTTGMPALPQGLMP